MNRTLTRSLPALAVGVVLALAPAAPAAPAAANGAAGPSAGSSAQSSAHAGAAAPVLLSTDGTHFAPSLDHGLFDFAGPLIPGGSAATELFVRNPTDRAVILTLGATHVTFSNREFADALSVIVSTTGLSPAPVTLGASAPCAVLLTGSRLAPGGTAQVDLALAMADVTGSVAQSQTASFTVRVSLTDAAGWPPADGCSGPGADIPALTAPGTPPTHSAPSSQGTQAGSTQSQSSLAHTGTDAWPPLLLGTALLGGGLAILAILSIRRRRERRR